MKKKLKVITQVRDRICVRLSPEQYAWVVSRGTPTEVVKLLIDNAMLDNPEKLMLPPMESCLLMSDADEASSAGGENIVSPQGKVIVPESTKCIESGSSMDQCALQHEVQCQAKQDWGRQRYYAVTKLPFEEWYEINKWRYAKVK